MFHDLFPLHFSDEELMVLHSKEGKRLASVDYIIWQNQSAKGDGYQALDWVELQFEDGDRIAFTAGEESDGLRIAPLDFPAEQLKIQQQFSGQVILEREPVSNGKVWNKAIGTPLSAVGLLEGPDGNIQNNQLQLDFNGIKIRFELHEEGMLVRRES